MFVWTFLLRITRTIISQSNADSSWITLYIYIYCYNLIVRLLVRIENKEIFISENVFCCLVQPNFGESFWPHGRLITPHKVFAPYRLLHITSYKNKYVKNPSIPWLCGSRRRFAAARALGLRVRIPPRRHRCLLWMFCFVQLRALATGRSHLQGSLHSESVCVIRCKNTPPHLQRVGRRGEIKGERVLINDSQRWR